MSNEAETPDTASNSPSEPQARTRRERRLQEAQAARSGAAAGVQAPHAEEPAANTTAAAAAHDDPIADLLSGTHTPGAAASDSGRKRRGWIGVLVAIVVIGALVAGVWALFGDRIGALFDGGNDYSGEGNGTEVEITVASGDTGTDIGGHLEEAGVVKTSEAFVSEVLSRSPEPEFHPGTYRLEEEMSAASALDRLLDPDSKVSNTFTIAEGLKAEQIYPLIADSTGIEVAELEQAAADPQALGLPDEAKTVEGFLFPATYTFEPDTDAATIIQTLVDRTYQAFDELGVPEEKVWDVIRMASLIEKEVFKEEDRYKVSRVFYNRIDVGMPLQSDATILYWTEDFDLEDESNPYNTYVHKGLMPGPISNPGAESIDAALNPADGDWLYFVTVNFDTGETVFSTTYEEHEKAVAQWKEWLKDHPEYQE